MINVTIDRKGDTVTLTLDVSERHGRSKSGKTEIIASSQGNVSIPGDDGIKLGLNCYCYPSNGQ